MRTETLNFSGATPANFAEQLNAILKNLDGVRDVLVIAAKNECSILFDEQRVSVPQIQSVLSAAGFDSKTAKPAHGQNGSCCGSCGG